MRLVGGTTIRSIGHIAELQTEDKDNDAAPDGKMILMEDNGRMTKILADAIVIWDNNLDSATSNVLQDILDKTERREWSLYEIMQ